MIREPGLDSKGPERFKDSLQPVKFDEPVMYKLDAVLNSLLTKGKPNLTMGWKTTPEVIKGFEDVLGGQALGEGLLDNNSGGARQLIFALAISPNPAIAELIGEKAQGHSAEVVQQMRDREALSGLKIIDLGCGSGSFAVAAKSMGAEVYTADADDLNKARKAILDGHIVINLGDKDAGVRLKAETGGNFDLVTENIIGRGWNEKVQLIPQDEFQSVIRGIAELLLKEGGYLYGSKFGMATKDGPFRKS